MVFTNFTDIIAQNTTFGLFKTINASFISPGLLMVLTLVALFIILFINFDAGSAKETFAVSMFITATISSTFWIAGIVPLFIVILTWILAMTAVMLTFLVK